MMNIGRDISSARLLPRNSQGSAAFVLIDKFTSANETPTHSAAWDRNTSTWAAFFPDCPRYARHGSCRPAGPRPQAGTPFSPRHPSHHAANGHIGTVVFGRLR